MKKSRSVNSFIKKPEYPGGREAMQKFLNSQLKYPAIAIENKVEGRVYLSYEVDQNGKVRHVEIRKGLGYGCDEESMRVVRLLEFSPQKNRGSRVTVKRKIYINFKLPKKAVPKVDPNPKPMHQKINQYNYTMKVPGRKETYSYSITLPKKK